MEERKVSMFGCQMSDKCLRSAYPLGTTIESNERRRKWSAKMNGVDSTYYQPYVKGVVCGYGVEKVRVCTSDGPTTLYCNQIKGVVNS